MGEIRGIAKRPYEAIQCFELALRIDPTRTNTRGKLAASFRAVNLPEMAKIQERLILLGPFEFVESELIDDQ